MYCRRKHTAGQDLATMWCEKPSASSWCINLIRNYNSILNPSKKVWNFECSLSIMSWPCALSDSGWYLDIQSNACGEWLLVFVHCGQTIDHLEGPWGCKQKVKVTSDQHKGSALISWESSGWVQAVLPLNESAARHSHATLNLLFYFHSLQWFPPKIELL